MLNVIKKDKQLCTMFTYKKSVKYNFFKKINSAYDRTHLATHIPHMTCCMTSLVINSDVRFSENIILFSLIREHYLNKLQLNGKNNQISY